MNLDKCFGRIVTACFRVTARSLHSVKVQWEFMDGCSAKRTLWKSERMILHVELADRRSLKQGWCQ
jgi:hypothetical protein